MTEGNREKLNVNNEIITREVLAKNLDTGLAN
jgi:hypothetical protein